MSGQEWLGTLNLGPVFRTGKWVKKIVSCVGVFNLAVEQPQLYRKQPPPQKKLRRSR